MTLLDAALIHLGLNKREGIRCEMTAWPHKDAQLQINLVLSKEEMEIISKIQEQSK